MAYTYVPEYLAHTFGPQYYDDLMDIMSSYYLLGFQPKPEAMGWGIEWNSAFEQERMTDTDFSMVNYCEAEKRLQEYERISEKAKEIMESLPQDKRDAFF